MPARPPENVTDTITVVSNTFHVLNFGSGTWGTAMRLPGRMCGHPKPLCCLHRRHAPSIISSTNAMAARVLDGEQGMNALQLLKH